MGLRFITAFVDNVWPLVNPCKIMFEWTDGLIRHRGASPSCANPTRMVGRVAAVLYVAFVWVELVFYGSSVPLSVAFLVLSYSVVTWIRMSVFGKDARLGRGEAYSSFFDILGYFAPTEVWVKTPHSRHACGVCEGVKEGCVNCYECFVNAPPEDRELDLRPLRSATPAPQTAHSSVPSCSLVSPTPTCWRPRCGSRL
jgi:hypothetical protein